MKWKLLKYPIWIFFSLLVMANFAFADTIGMRLPVYITLDSLDISGNLDLEGYSLTNVGGISGNSTYIGFGDEVTSHSLTGKGSIVVDMFEANGASYFDSATYFPSGDWNSSFLNLNSNIEIRFGSGAFMLGRDSSENKLRFGVGSDCTAGANVAFEIDSSTDCKVVNDLSVGGDLTVTGEIIGGAKTYAEMYREAYGVATTIDTSDVWHMVSTTTVGLTSHWTHDNGDTGAITAYADATGGLVYVTSAGHGMSAGNMISISGSTNYNALEEVVAVWTDSFTVTAAWAGDDAAGTWIKGASLTAGSTGAGTYKLTWGVTITPETNNHIFTLACSKNAVQCSKCRARTKTGTAGSYEEITGSALFTVAEGDIINLLIKNVGATGNVTIRHGNVNLHRI